MNASEARKITDLHARNPDNAAQDLAEYAHCQIRNAANSGRSQVTNPFRDIRGMYSEDERQKAYVILEQEGYLVARVGDSNMVISW